MPQPTPYLPHPQKTGAPGNQKISTFCQISRDKMILVNDMISMKRGMIRVTLRSMHDDVAFSSSDSSEY